VNFYFGKFYIFISKIAIVILKTTCDTFIMNSEWLRTQFELHPSKSKADLARALRLKPSAISKILSQTRQIKANEYCEMRRFFGLPVDGERSLELYVSSFSQGDLGLSDNNIIADIDWTDPNDDESRFLTMPKRVKVYRVTQETGSVRFCLGETLLLDPDYKISATAEPFVVSIDTEEIIALCHIDNKNIIHVRPFGGRQLTTHHSKENVEVLGYIFSKMEMV